MKVISYTCLHYGIDFLASAIRSIIDAVDDYYVFYTPVGSHGFRTDVPCPETREQLYREARYAAGDKLHWVDGTWPHEGAHREAILQYAPDADVILVLDSDEIWSERLVKNCLKAAKAAPIRQRKLPMVHFWRSFRRSVIDDASYPVRVIQPKAFDGTGALEMANPGHIAHMGYAQNSDTVTYKILTHGHSNEWRHDCNWLYDRFMCNAQRDCHPVVVNYWNPVEVNPLDYLPAWMESHPYWDCEVIP